MLCSKDSLFIVVFTWSGLSTAASGMIIKVSLFYELHSEFHKLNAE